MRGNNKTAGGTKFAPPAPVILGLVPRILFQQGFNLVNKFALLLHKCWLREDSWDKPKNDWCRGRGFRVFSQSGRSMIEMLGVLAIIGVLSVAGIAGYSKAMMMWRSNVQRNMLTELISGVIRLQSNLPPDIGDAPEIDLTPILGAMGLLPEGTKYEDDWIQDKYGVKAQVGYSYISGNIYFIRLYYVPTEGEGISPYQELCRNVVQVTKPLADKIYQLRSWKTESENSSYSIIYYGKDLATETVEETNRKCKNVAFGVHMTIVFKF